ncbi:polysaccharide pyruvyl transferase family protein [Nocardia panacis]|uniref:polysaccharide pyruvyl transferase family protein n=1 Tax=Nocardia panacis TaxID=2340916 RepID=UPI001EF137CD|nr:polysaccharide pyruvyl transferase family protein [Nocardia panacis]
MGIVGARRAGGPRILVENGTYRLRDRGDIAALTITVERLRERWPLARIGVLTHRPAVLRGLSPRVEPISGPDWSWPSRDLRSRVRRTAAAKLVDPMALRWQAAIADSRDRMRPWKVPRASAPPQVFAAARGVDLVLAAGGGYLCDAERDQAHRTLDLLEYAAAQGIPTAMVGQGIGPIEDAELAARARKVLPAVDLIAVRESERGPRLLTDLGVPPARIMVTGEDAIEYAYRLRDARIGDDIGLCVRLNDSIGKAAMAALGTAVRKLASHLNAGILPLIGSENDRRATLYLMAGSDRARPAVSPTATATEVARRIAGCRVVITASYNLAVCALAQGIPAVALAESPCAAARFRGLATMFDADMCVLRLDSPTLDSDLATAVRTSWSDAPLLRDPLHERALAQIEAGRTALDRVFDLVAGDRPGCHAPVDGSSVIWSFGDPRSSAEIVVPRR